MCISLYREGIDDVFHFAVYVLEYPAYAQKNEYQYFLRLVQPFGKTALFDHIVENMASHIIQAHVLVAPEIKGGDGGRGNELPIGILSPAMFAMVHFFQ